MSESFLAVGKNILRDPLREPLRGLSANFNSSIIQRAIASLRARGSDAHLWLPGVGTLSGLTTGNYLESTGSTLGTVDNPCGLVLDALGSVGVELFSDFAVEQSPWVQSGASWSVNGSQAGNADIKIDPWSITLGKTYKFTFTVSGASSSLIFYLGKETTVTYGNGTHTAHVSATANYFYVRAAAGVSATIDNISVREVSGIHLTQGTTASKPVLRRGLTNLFAYSSDILNPAWIKANVDISVVSGVVESPSNAPVYKVMAQSGKSNGSAYRIYQGPNLAAGTYTAAILFKAGSGAPYIGVTSDFASTEGCIFNAATGALDTTLGSTYTGTSVAVGPDGWFLLSVKYTATTADSDNHHFFSLTNRITTIANGADPAFVGGEYAYFSSVGLFQGSYTASQILAAGGIPVTTTAAASNPNAGKYSWSFDGSNDSLALGSVPFQMGDDHCVIAGFKATDNGIHKTVFVCENGSARVAQMRVTANLLMAIWQDSGTSVLYSSPLSVSESVVGACRQIGTTLALRKNGVQVDTGTRPAGSTTMTAANIGVGNTTEIFTGTTGPIIAIKGTVTDAELLMYERLIAALTPGAPSF